MSITCSHFDEKGPCRGKASLTEDLCFYHRCDWQRDEDGRFIGCIRTYARRLAPKGVFEFTMQVKGFEVDDDWYEMLKGNPELKEAFLAT